MNRYCWIPGSRGFVVAVGAGLVAMAAIMLEPSRAQVAAPAQKATGKAAAEPRGKSVPFEMLPSNHMLVEAKINGKGPYHLVFDLGAPITLLGNRASEASGVVKKNAPKSFLMGMRGEATINSIEAGELKAANVPVIVFDHPVLDALAEMTARKIDGIIGFTFFARYKTTIDYEARRMTFEPVDFTVRDLFKELPDRLAGTRKQKQTVIAPAGLWGIELGRPIGGLEQPGMVVASVFPGSPAAIAGLKAGDVITTIDGRWTTSTRDVFLAAQNMNPGQAAEVVVLREKAEIVLSIKPQPGA